MIGSFSNKKDNIPKSMPEDQKKYFRDLEAKIDKIGEVLIALYADSENRKKTDNKAKQQTLEKEDKNGEFVKNAKKYLEERENIEGGMLAITFAESNSKEDEISYIPKEKFYGEDRLMDGVRNNPKKVFDRLYELAIESQNKKENVRTLEKTVKALKDDMEEKDSELSKKDSEYDKALKHWSRQSSRNTFDTIFADIVKDDDIRSIYERCFNIEDTLADKVKSFDTNLFTSLTLLSALNNDYDFSLDPKFYIKDREKDFAQLISFYLLASLRSNAIDYQEFKTVLAYCNKLFEKYTIEIPLEKSTADQCEDGSIEHKNIFNPPLDEGQKRRFIQGRIPVLIEQYKFLPITHNDTPDYSSGNSIFGCIDINIEPRMTSSDNDKSQDND